MNQNEGMVKAVARAFWRTWQFWACAGVIIVMCMLVGYLIGTWQANSVARVRFDQQERAYKEASDARKAVLQQCLTTNNQLTTRLTALGDKATDTAKAATDALQKLSGDMIPDTPENRANDTNK